MFGVVVFLFLRLVCLCLLFSYLVVGGGRLCRFFGF